MGHPIPAPHASVSFRSRRKRIHRRLDRRLLILAMVAVLALAAAVVILANDDDQVGSVSKVTPAALQPQTEAGTRYDGGPEEGTRGAISTPQVAPAGTRYDGGPEEGSRGPEQVQLKESTGGPIVIPQGPLSR